jgi:DNA-binding NarL/FixJ family response regulator
MLTSREREVLVLIADGESSKRIAHRLGISFKTVVTHRTNIMQKLEAHDVATLVRRAIRCGLIEP